MHLELGSNITTLRLNNPFFNSTIQQNVMLYHMKFTIKISPAVDALQCEGNSLSKTQYMLLRSRFLIRIVFMFITDTNHNKFKEKFR